jgi:class 3 adenylate cyclase/tetratricopeptide (TPR) repeat protein
MRCTSCYADNPGRATACAACGADLAPKCPRCFAENAPGARFCSQCGRALERHVALPGEGTGERRQLTVLFCDLVAATPLVVRLGPEEWSHLLSAYHAACSEVVARYEGHVAQYLGDGLLVYFGYPIAFDDAPRRAVQAGLALLEAVASQDARLRGDQGLELCARVGIHSGSVVVENIGERRELLALGDVPHMAARVQAFAAPGTLVITETTQRLTSGFFTCESLGPKELKGFATQVTLHQVTGESGAASRLEAASFSGLTRFTGRAAERAELEALWQTAKQGQGPVALLVGEPGIGKSRHIAELKYGLDEEPHTYLECRCSPSHQVSPLYPVVDLIERTLGLRRELPAAEIVRRLEVDLRSFGRDDPQDVRLLGSLLSLPLGEECPPPSLPAARRRQATFDLLLAWLGHRASQRPTLFVVEDLHWADPSTVELLTLLVAVPPPGPLLTLFTTRPEFKPPWPANSRCRVLSVQRLGPDDMAAMVDSLTEGRPLGPEVVRQLMDRADGVPLFLEEIIKGLLESGSDAIPASVQDTLMARLDRLGPQGKALAQLAAVLGREFRHDLLAAAVGVPEDVFARNLTRLLDAQVLLRAGPVGSLSSPGYVFKHALIQDAAYQSLLRPARQAYHRQIGETLATRFPEVAATRPEILAHHFSSAGLAREAIAHWAAAGHRAIAGSAYTEAIKHFRSGLAESDALPSSPQRARQELDLRAGMGLALITARGFAAKEVEESYTRAAELCDQLGAAPPLRVLYGIWGVNLVRNDPAAVGLLVPHFERLGQSRDRQAALIAGAVLGTYHFWSGQYDRSLESMRGAMALCDPQDPKREHEALMREHGFEGRLYPALYLAWCHLLMGRGDTARRLLAESLTLADLIGDAYVVVGAQTFGAAVHHDLGDLDAARVLAERARATAVDRGFPFWQACAQVIVGRTMVRPGESRDESPAGLALIDDGLALFRLTGAKLPFAYYASYRAEACMALGQTQQALETLDEVLALTAAAVERNYQPELLRLKGEALLAHGDHETAEELFRRSAAECHAQGAYLLKARAATSLGRLCQAVGRPDDARRLLEDVSGVFNEGLDLRDVRAARQLAQRL